MSFEGSIGSIDLIDRLVELGREHLAQLEAREREVLAETRLHRDGADAEVAAEAVAALIGHAVAAGRAAERVQELDRSEGAMREERPDDAQPYPFDCPEQNEAGGWGVGIHVALH